MDFMVFSFSEVDRWSLAASLWWSIDCPIVEVPIARDSLRLQPSKKDLFKQNLPPTAWHDDWRKIQTTSRTAHAAIHIDKTTPPMFQIIKGTFHVRGFQPDGDSIRFKPERPSAWEALTWPRSKPKSRRRNPAIQLRLEGIDALEIHTERLENCGRSSRRPMRHGD